MHVKTIEKQNCVSLVTDEPSPVLLAKCDRAHQTINVYQHVDARTEPFIDDFVDQMKSTLPGTVSVTYC